MTNMLFDTSNPAVYPKNQCQTNRNIFNHPNVLYKNSNSICQCNFIPDLTVYLFQKRIYANAK